MIEFLAGFVIGGILGGLTVAMVFLDAAKEESDKYVRNSDKDEHGDGL